MWCEPQKSCWHYNPHTSFSSRRNQPHSKRPVPSLYERGALQWRHDVRNIQWEGTDSNVNVAGTITVSNGTNSVTMPGVTMNLSGAISVQGGAGIQLVRHPNGDVTVAANPTVASGPAKPTTGTNNGPPGVTATDTLKELGKTAGNGLSTVVVSPVAVVGGVGLTVGGALVGLAEGHPIKTTKEVAGEIWSDVSKVIDWAGGWF